jgi:Leucine-rich repeat (LRR) protein
MCQLCDGDFDESITVLVISYCRRVTSIPDNLVNLERLHCYNTAITSIPDTLINLRQLFCYNTKITSIPSTLVNLHELYCSDNNITSIPSTLVNLQDLYCNRTKILSIPSSLVNLTILNCCNTKVTSVPTVANLFIDNCPWLEQENIDKIIPLQKRFRTRFYLRRSLRLSKYFYPDIISIIL